MYNGEHGAALADSRPVIRRTTRVTAGTELHELGIDSERRLAKPDYKEPKRFTSIPREMKKLGVEWYQARAALITSPSLWHCVTHSATTSVLIPQRPASCVPMALLEPWAPSLNTANCYDITPTLPPPAALPAHRCWM